MKPLSDEGLRCSPTRVDGREGAQSLGWWILVIAASPSIIGLQGQLGMHDSGVAEIRLERTSTYSPVVAHTRMRVGAWVANRTRHAKPQRSARTLATGTSTREVPNFNVVWKACFERGRRYGQRVKIDPPSGSIQQVREIRDRHAGFRSCRCGVPVGI